MSLAQGVLTTQQGGTVGLASSTAAALGGYGVRVNAICPRARTRMTEDVFAGLGRPADGPDPLGVEHVAPLVGYLSSPAADRITGRLFVVHGGMVAVMDRPRGRGEVRHRQGGVHPRRAGRPAHPVPGGP